MSKILIFRFEQRGGPGYFSQYLDRHQIPYQVLKLDQGQPIPDSIDGISGLVFMGGVMSVNDDLEWIPGILDLIRSAQSNNIPMLGHCLGGQLIAKALGGSVTRNTVEEIGWLPVDVIDNGGPGGWNPELPPTLHVFQWHNETFSIPPDARHLFHRPTCPNQGFQIGNSLALQFHLEILADIVEDWSSHIVNAAHPVSETVQSRKTMIEDLPAKMDASRFAADRIYGNWCRTLR